MAQQVTKPAATGIATDLVNKLVAGIADSRQSTVIAGGKPLMRMLKSGEWVFGQRDDAMQEGSSWAVNPLSILHGWCAWTNREGATKNELVGEVMVPVHEPKPIRPAPVDNWPFSEQRMMDLRCMDGDDEGTETVYKTSSVGGMRAFDELLGALQGQLASAPQFPCPVIQLQSDNYQHPKYGRIYVPVFEVVDWATMDGKLQSEAPAQIEPEPEPAKPEPQHEPEVTRAARQPKTPLKKPIPAKAATPAPTARRRAVKR